MAGERTVTIHVTWTLDDIPVSVSFQQQLVHILVIYLK